MKDWVVVQRFYVIHPSGDVYEEKYRQQERWETRKKNSGHALMHSDYVYDRLDEFPWTWTVMKDRINGHWEQVMPSDEDLFMMILSAKSVKDYAYK